jgi:biopolymer transport protein ExbD
MAIKFQCPSCKAIRAANERLMGREISCPECGSPVQLPSMEQVQEAKAERERMRRELHEQEERLNRFLAKPTAVAVPYVVAVAVADDEDGETRMDAEEKALAAASAKFVRPKPPQGEDMDMTPMVDVTFLLLIFFMITASFSVQKAIQRPAQLKEDPSNKPIEQPEDPKDTVTVQVDEFNAYNILMTDGTDRVAGSKQDLIVALSDAHEGGGSGSQPTKLVVQAHENCIHAAVIAALDAGREAKFESFEVSTVEQFD